ncbi:MAG TPA: tripartite tricarboxylate transporter substrate binding protein [Burkholderiales bacterium]|nr:tripartite tricarboxylate transporter substrate binding protein [Burkholderiales bacterium]
MLNIRPTIRIGFAAIAMGLCASAAAQQQSYPVKPIRLVVPYPPGGPSDYIARAMNEMLGKRLGQPVIVDNRGGAASIIGAEIAARAPADGYTMLVATVTTLAANPALKAGLPYDPVRDFAPVAMLGASPYVLAVHPGVPAKTAAQLVAYAKANPGKLSFGSAGTGSSAHLAGELFKHLAGIDIVHVPYKGSGPAIVDLIGGQIGLIFSSVSGIQPHVNAGRLRALGVSTIKRSASMPDVPTLDESGVKGYQTRSWNSLVAPRGTPVPIIQRLNKEVNAVLSTSEIGDRIKKQGVETDPGTPADLARYINEEIVRFRNLISAIHLKREQI